MTEADMANLFTNGERWEYRSGIREEPKIVTIVSVGYHEHSVLVHVEHSGRFVDFYLPKAGSQLIAAEDGYLSFRVFGDDVASLRRISGAPLGT